MLGVAHQIKKSGIKTATTPVKKATKTASYTPILPNPLLRTGGTVGVRRFGIRSAMISRQYSVQLQVQGTGIPSRYFSIFLLSFSLSA